MSELLENFSLIFLVFLVSANLALSFIVYRNNSRSTTNKIFVILGLVISSWAVVMHFSLKPNNQEMTLLLAQFSLFFAAAQNSLFLLLSIILPNEKLSIPNKFYLFILVSTLAVMLLTLTPLVFSEAKIVDGIATLVPGPAIFIFPLFIVITSVLSIGILIRRIKKATGLLRTQLITVFFGVTMMLGLIVATIVIPVAIFQLTIFVPLFPLYTLAFTASTAYAILKHKLFDVKVIATEAFTIVLWIILFSKLFVAGNTGQIVIETLVLTVVVIFGILLIRSVIREVKQRKKLEELTKKLKELDEQKDEFVNVAAHELRAPMTAIKGYLSMIQEGDAGKISNTVKDYLDQAVEGNERLIRLVNNMLNVSRIEEGRMVFEMGEVDLNEVVKTVVNEYQEQASKKGLKLALNTSAEARYIVHVDKDRIYEVVNNFISNAIKYTDKGGINVKVQLTSNHTVRVEVIDTGTGMTDDELKHLFEKFYRAESNVGKQIGTGLGLYISKLLIDKFGGKIGVESEKGKGSTFWFELPLRK